MFMKLKKDYSLVRGLITRAIRELEILYHRSKFKPYAVENLSEYDYWISSLELIRNCLYGCKKDYSGQIDISNSIKEIRSEITNFIKVIRSLRTRDLECLDRAWQNLTKAEKEL